LSTVEHARGRSPAAPIVLAAGIGLIVAAQLVAPVAAPLFDGLTVLGPYHYLAPAAGQSGDPTSATVTEQLANGASPGFNAATSESPPQAQLIAAPDAFQLDPGSTSVTVTIKPIAPPAPSTVGTILGNVYEYSVADQNGVQLATRAGNDVTLVLRAPDATTEAVVAEFANGAWAQIDSSPSGSPAFFLGTTSTLGSFALVQAQAGFGPLEVSLLVLVAGAILGGIGFLVLRRRRRMEPAPTSAAGGRAPAGGAATRTGNRKRKRR
jgi:hypothetical protein